MKTIIAGGRDYYFSEDDEEYKFLDELDISFVVTGGCRGADECGLQYAIDKGIPYKIFPADWNMYGRSAGPIRNAEMAAYADQVVLFPGGRGTESMRREAIKAGLKIAEFPN